MRVVLFFDLPTLTVKDKKNYIIFRKKLIQSGFIMLQFSVYSKLVANQQGAEAVGRYIKSISTNSGSIQLLTVTERQFSQMKFISGTRQTEIEDRDNGLIII